MTKRERAIRAARNEAEKRGWLFDTPVHAADLGAIIDAAMAIMAEPDEPPEGKLLVRACICLGEDGEWFINGSHEYDTRADFRDAARPRHCILEPVYRWIEADVTPWQPPAEETVQGREVEG